MNDEITNAVRLVLASLGPVLGLVFAIIFVFLSRGTLMSRITSPLHAHGKRLRGGLQSKLGNALQNSSYLQKRRELKAAQKAEVLSGARKPGWRPSHWSAAAQRRFYASGVSGATGAALYDETLAKRQEAQTKMKDAFSRVNPYATQAFMNNAEAINRGDTDKLFEDLDDLQRDGKINIADRAMIDRLRQTGQLRSATTMAGATEALASTGFLYRSHVKNAESALNQQYGEGSRESVVALNQMAASINAGAKSAGMAKDMRWGVVGDTIIQNGQDYNATLVPAAVSAGGATAMGRWYESNVTTELGFQKLPSASNISRKSFEDPAQDGGKSVDAFREALLNDSFKTNVVLTAAGVRGEMNAQDRAVLLAQAQAAIGTGAAWATAVSDAKEKVGLRR